MTEDALWQQLEEEQDLRKDTPGEGNSKQTQKPGALHTLDAGPLKVATRGRTHRAECERQSSQTKGGNSQSDPDSPVSGLQFHWIDRWTWLRRSNAPSCEVSAFEADEQRVNSRVERDEGTQCLH
eukprot:383324-Amphidinium_carterae.1